MQLTYLIAIKKYVLKSVFASLCITMFGYTNFIIAEPLTYSPDQWPRHWNVLMDKTHLKDRLNGYRTNGKGKNQAPARSPMWGVVPVAKPKSRRSVRPEYNTNSHMQNYYGQNNYRRNYYSGFSGYGFQTPYVAPLMSPYGVSALAPGLAAPGIPFGVSPVLATPFMGGVPVMGGFPRTGYMW